MPGYAKNILDALSGSDALDVDLRTGGAAVSPTNPLAVGKAYSSSVSAARPNDTTPYTAGDVVGAVGEFTSIGPAGGRIMITDVILRVDVAAIPSGMTTFRLHLYNATPPSALTDNAAWDLPSGDRASYLGFVDIGTPSDVGSTLWVERQGVNKIVDLAPASTSLFWYLQTIGGYTPTAQASKAIKIYTLAVG